MEIEHRGWRVVEVETDAECLGVPMRKAYQVMDEFDDPLPILHNLFWSPLDAVLAIDFVVDVFDNVKGGKWPTTKTHEFNIAINYRRNFVEVYQCLRKINKVIQDAREMGDDPSSEIDAMLHALHLRCLNGAPRHPLPNAERSASGAASG